MLVTADARLARRLARAGQGTILPADDSVRMWTDDFSNLFAALR
jgi:hypothetical protein